MAWVGYGGEVLYFNHEIQATVSGCCTETDGTKPNPGHAAICK